MGRLFWKFFFFVLLVQAVTVVAFSMAIWLRQSDTILQIGSNPTASSIRLLDAASVTIEHGGASALKALLEDWARTPGSAVYAVDPRGSELLGRAIPRELDAVLTDRRARPDASRRVTASNGDVYRIIVDEQARDGAMPRSGAAGPQLLSGRMPFGLPVEPLVVGILISLAVAALLAWYVSKPIRSLRRAFDRAAQGNLDDRIGDSMGRRRDELADLGRDFDRTAARLKALMDGQRRLLHDVSHELRSPLARLQVAVGLARQQPDNCETSMDRIERESVRMDRLLDELLTLSRVEAGISDRRDDNISLVELVNDVVQDASFEVANSAPIAFDLDLSALGGANVKGNGEMLHRALENVVRNAVRHTPPDAHVHIAGWPDLARREIHLMIADDGPGVPVDDLETIFQPFFRGAAANGTGHGLGLAIARKVVEAHGGSISASNLTSGGLAVEIRLPALPA